MLGGVTVATDSPYWNPKTETLDRERLGALQLAKLRRQCEWAAARSPWYRRRFEEERFRPAQLRAAADQDYDLVQWVPQYRAGSRKPPAGRDRVRSELERTFEEVAHP